MLMPGYTNLNHPPPAAPSLALSLLPARRALEPSSSTPSIAAALVLSTRNKSSGSRRQLAETATAAPAPSRRCGEPHSRSRSGSPSLPSSRPGAPTPQSTSTPAAASRRGPTPSSSTAGARVSTRRTPHPTPPHPSSGTPYAPATASARFSLPRLASPFPRAPRVLWIAYACWWAGSDGTVECGAFR